MIKSENIIKIHKNGERLKKINKHMIIKIKRK